MYILLLRIKRYIFLVIMMVLCMMPKIFAQETIRIMSYNMKSYASNTDRDGYFISVLSLINPDICVGIEIKSQTWAENFRDNVLNQIGNGTYTMGNYVSFSGGNGTNTIFYRSDKFTFISATKISNNPVIVFTLNNTSTNRQIVIFGIHLSASSDDTERQNEVNTIRNITDAYASNIFFIAVGDYNFPDATVTSFGMMTNSTNSGYFIDPEGYDGTVSWSGNHLLRTHNIQTSFQYRHDLILNSQSVVHSGGIEYVDNSFTIPGNVDGTEGNIPQVYKDASDHLPVYADYLFYDTPGPVEISLFTGVFKRDRVELNWKTETEVNNYGFDIERSPAPGTDWKSIGFVKGHGNSNSPKYYYFYDKDIKKTGTFLYRLKQIDNDGTIDYSNVITVSLGVPNNFYLSQNYPNPFNPTTKIDYTIPDRQLVSLRIYNILGEMVNEVSNEVKDAGYYSATIDASNLPSGVYYYRLTAGKYNLVKKMIVQK